MVVEVVVVVVDVVVDVLVVDVVDVVVLVDDEVELVGALDSTPEPQAAARMLASVSVASLEPRAEMIRP